MQFSIPTPTEEDKRQGFLEGGLALTFAIPVGITFLLPGHAPVRWGYLAAALAITLLPIGYFIWVATTFTRRTLKDAQPETVLALIIIESAALACLAGAFKNAEDMYAVGFVVLGVFTGLLGGFAIRVIGWAAISGGAVASLALSGSRGMAFWLTALTLLTIIGAVEAMSYHVIFDLSGMAKARLALDSISDTAASYDSLLDGIEACLALVPYALPTNHVSAFLSRGKSVDFEVISAWPDLDPRDIRLPSESAFQEASSSNMTVVSKERCFIPAGFTSSGQLMLVVDRKNTKKYSQTMAIELSEALGSVFMRLAHRLDSQQQLKHSSRTDPLTGLANRRSLFERLDQELARAQRSSQPLCLLMIDLDHFKVYNDTNGHLAGDQLLKNMATMMSTRVRAQDLLARYGGEEFCVVLPGTPASAAVRVAESLRGISHEATAEAVISVSVGVTQGNGTESAESLIERADRALYEAKESGRDKVVSLKPTEAVV